jgi:predicted DNA-binding mobile mystery protein A
MDARQTQARRRLDERLAQLKPVSRFAIPRRGWVRAVRDVLGMTAGQLGGRIGMRPQSVLDLEKSEIAGTVQLKTLRKAAAALDCTLVYALVPNSTLDAYVMTRAREVARRELARVDHSMALEDQGLSDAEREARLEDYVREYIRTSGIWDAV